MLGERVGARLVPVPVQARGGEIQIRGHAVEPSQIIGTEIRRELHGLLVEDGAVKAVQVALRIPVHFANAQTVVARLANHLRQLDRVLLGHTPVAEHAVTPGRLAREQRGARRRTGGCRRVGVAKPHALLRDAVEVRRVDGAVAVRAQAIAAMLIRHDQQKVGAAARTPPQESRCGGCAEECATRHALQHISVAGGLFLRGQPRGEGPPRGV